MSVMMTRHARPTAPCNAICLSSRSAPHHSCSRSRCLTPIVATASSDSRRQARGEAVRGKAVPSQIPKSSAKEPIRQQAWIWDRIPQQADMKLVLAITVPAVLFLAREPLESGWGGYCEALESYPLPVKMATGAVGTFLGDLLAQWAGSSGVTVPGSQPVEFKYDLPRAVRFIVYATFIGTPLAHLWFGVLDDNISPLDPTSPMAVLGKMLADQVLACPVFTTLFFISMKVMEGHPEEAVQSVKDKLWPTLVANYILWPAAHIINFAFIPPSQRILYCNAIAVFWTAYMSYALAAEPTPAVALELTSPAEAEKQKKL